MSRISVCILTKNAQATLERTLQSFCRFPEVILLDSGSTDSTLQIAKEFPNVKIFETQFCGFGPLRNQVASYANNDWILALDSDEVVSDELFQEIMKTQLAAAVAYAIPRHNFYNGKRIRGCGWSPDYVARLYHRKNIRYSESLVHEALVLPTVKNNVILKNVESPKMDDRKRHCIDLIRCRLRSFIDRKISPSLNGKLFTTFSIPTNIAYFKSPIFHTPYRSTEEFLSKMQHYSTLFAKQYQGKKRSSFRKAFLHGMFAFAKSYVLKRGFLDGAEGFIISLYNANTAFYKYMKLKELNQETQ